MSVGTTAALPITAATRYEYCAWSITLCDRPKSAEIVPKGQEQNKKGIGCRDQRRHRDHERSLQISELHGLVSCVAEGPELLNRRPRADPQLGSDEQT